jgi:hypothetical protein
MDTFLVGFLGGIVGALTVLAVVAGLIVWRAKIEAKRQREALAAFQEAFEASGSDPMAALSLLGDVSNFTIIPDDQAEGVGRAEQEEQKSAD